MKAILAVTLILPIFSLSTTSCDHASRKKPVAIPSQLLERPVPDQQGQPSPPVEENLDVPAETELPASGISRDDLIPTNWNVLSEATGDLNRDKVDDLLLVVEGTDSLLIENTKHSEDDADRLVDHNPRILAIYFKNLKTGLFEKKLQSNSFILKKESFEMVEPFNGATISDQGILWFGFHFWTSLGSWATWNSDYMFRYQNNRFELIGFEYDNSWRHTGETAKHSINFLTKKMIVTRGNFEKEDHKTEETKRIQIDRLMALEEMTSSTDCCEQFME